MLKTTSAQLARYANDVAVLWDEAQDNPALLRFLSPFGRPDLGRLMRRFQTARSEYELISEGYPMFATWLATMVSREEGLAPVKLQKLEPPQWNQSMMTPTLELVTALELGQSRLHTVVVTGSLKAPMVIVRNARLVVAGDLETQLLIADGCVLVGGSVTADIVSSPASQLTRKDRGEFDLARPLGWQIGREVRCKVFDSPRFGLGCPVKAELVLRGVGLTVTPDVGERLRERLVPDALTSSQLKLDRIAALISSGKRVFTS